MEFAKILINKLECVAREQEKDEVLCKKMQEVREQATVGVSFFFCCTLLSQSFLCRNQCVGRTVRSIAEQGASGRDPAEAAGGRRQRSGHSGPARVAGVVRPDAQPVARHDVTLPAEHDRFPLASP